MVGVWRELMKITKLLETLLKVKNPDIKVLYLIAQCHYRIREERNMLIKYGIKEGDVN